MWCSEVWDVNSIYEYLGVNLFKIIWESNTALLWPQGLPSACRSGSWLQRCLKHKQKGEAGHNDRVTMGSQSRARVWVLSLKNEVFWSVGSSSVPPQTTTVEKRVTKLLSTSEQMRSSTTSSEADCNFNCINHSLLRVRKMKGMVRKKPYLLHICTLSWFRPGQS